MPRLSRPRPPSLLLAVLLAALTCDDSRRNEPLAARVARAFCAHRFACCSPFELSAMTSDRYTNEAECVEFATLAARQQLGTVEGAIAQGRITIDDARADACLEGLRAQVCGAEILALQDFAPLSPLPNATELLASCPDMLVGHVANNRACNLSEECTSGSRCLSGTPGNPGNPIPGAGGTGGTVIATPGICVPYQRAGEPCNQSSDCEPRFTCRTPAYTCGLKPQLGEPCAVEFDMVTGYPISTCDTSQGLYCDQPFNGQPTNGVCRRYPLDGQPCNQFSLPQCDPDPMLGLRCNQFSGTCRRPGNEGDACGGPAIPPCREDLGCHPTQADGIGICGAIPGLGEPCFDRCVSPAVCLGTRCVSPGAARIGEPCTSDTDCAALSCNGFQSGQRTCSATPYFFARCVGVGVTPGNLGNPGTGGITGTGGTFATGKAGSGPATGTAGAGGSLFGCPFSDIAPGDPIIADFDVAMGSTPILPIGGTFTYGSTSPTATASSGAWHITVEAPGAEKDLFLGAGIFFNASPTGIACLDASFHTGVQFDISGRIEGTGCTAQYATNDSAHTDATFDPKGSGPPGSWSPQATLMVTATPATVMMPFNGAGAPTGGSPAIGIDKARLTGVQWQFTVAAGATNSCTVDVTIDNVRFF
jgi:hypothetical protein